MWDAFGTWIPDNAPVTETLSDGSTMITEPDGSVWEVSADGTIYALDTNGIVTVMDASGNIVTDSTQSAVSKPSDFAAAITSGMQQVTSIANAALQTVKAIQTAKATGGPIKYTATGQPYVTRPVSVASTSFGGISMPMLLALGVGAIVLMKK